MSRQIIDVPGNVRAKARLHGVAGARWLRDLGETIEGLERDWGVVVGPTLGGGSDSYVAAARTHDGEDAVLKIAIPSAAVAGQVATLRAADGRGYARLLRHDDARRALLLERLGPALADLGLGVGAQIEVIAATLQRAWMVPADPRLQTGAEKARWLAEFIQAAWETLARPCSERVVERALSFAAARAAAFDPDAAVLVHGDAHAANTLRALGHGARGETGFKFVDPDGLFAEPAYDLAVPMREWSRELLDGDAVRLGRARCADLARLAGVDPEPVWEWGFVERVSTGLLALQVGRDELARDILAVAEAFAAPQPPRLTGPRAAS